MKKTSTANRSDRHRQMNTNSIMDHDWASQIVIKPLSTSMTFDITRLDHDFQFLYNNHFISMKNNLFRITIIMFKT